MTSVPCIGVPLAPGIDHADIYQALLDHLELAVASARRTGPIPLKDALFLKAITLHSFVLRKRDTMALGIRLDMLNRAMISDEDSIRRVILVLGTLSARAHARTMQVIPSTGPIKFNLHHYSNANQVTPPENKAPPPPPRRQMAPEERRWLDNFFAKHNIEP